MTSAKNGSGRVAAACCGEASGKGQGEVRQDPTAATAGFQSPSSPSKAWGDSRVLDQRQNPRPWLVNADCLDYLRTAQPFNTAAISPLPQSAPTSPTFHPSSLLSLATTLQSCPSRLPDHQFSEPPFASHSIPSQPSHRHFTSLSLHLTTRLKNARSNTHPQSRLYPQPLSESVVERSGGYFGHTSPPALFPPLLASGNRQYPDPIQPTEEPAPQPQPRPKRPPIPRFPWYFLTNIPVSPNIQRERRVD